MDSFINNLSGAINMDILKEKVENKTSLSAYWGVEPIEEPSIDILIPLLKLRSMIHFNIDVIILLADVHALLNKSQYNDNRVENKTIFYKFIITTIFKSFDIDPSQYEFAYGSEIQLDKKYMIDLYKFMNMLSIEEAREASKDIVLDKCSANVGSLVYPMMQVLDETVLGTDIQIGDKRQYKTFLLSSKFTETLGYKKSTYFIYPYLTPLDIQLNYYTNVQTGKISTRFAPLTSKRETKTIHTPPTSPTHSNSPTSPITILDLLNKSNHPDNLNNKLKKIIISPGRVNKIYFSDVYDEIKEKISNAVCVAGEIDLSKAPCLSLVKYICYPLNKTILEYDTYEKFELAWFGYKMTEHQLKKWLVDALDDIIAPIREQIELNKAIYNEAY